MQTIHSSLPKTVDATLKREDITLYDLVDAVAAETRLNDDFLVEAVVRHLIRMGWVRLDRSRRRVTA